MSRKSRSYLPALLFFLLVAVGAYGAALDNPAIFDDRALIAGNPNLTPAHVGDLFTRDYFQIFGGAPVGYRPLSTFTYIVNGLLWGENFPMWRLFYICWHACNAFLLFLLLGRFLPALPSFLAGTFFVLHPLHSETINQISYNEDIMVTGFLLLATIFFLDYMERGKTAAKSASVLSLLLALLSKETALFYFLVPSIWFLCRKEEADGAWGKERARRILSALVAATVAYGALLALLWRNPAEQRQLDWSIASITEGLPAAMSIFSDFLSRFAFPLNLSAVYEYGSGSWKSPGALAGAVLTLALLGLVAAGLKRSDPSLAVPGVWYLSGLAPLGYSLLFPAANYSYDHYLYGPSMGLAAYLAIGFTLAGSGGSLRRAVPWVLTFLCLPLFLVVVQQRNAVWSSDLRLWEDALEAAPGSLHARYNYAYSLQHEGRTDEAQRQYRLVLQDEAGYTPAWHNLGRIAMDEGRKRDGERYFLQAVGTDPADADSLVALGDISLGRGDHGSAEKLYIAAAAGRPGYAKPVEHLADLYFARGRDREAVELYGKLVAARADFAKGWHRLGIISLRQGDAREAVRLLRAALEADPDRAGAAEDLERAMEASGESP